MAGTRRLTSPAGWWAGLLLLLLAVALAPATRGRASAAAAALGPSHVIKAVGGGFWGRSSSSNRDGKGVARPSLWGVRGGADEKKEEEEGEASNPVGPAAAGHHHHHHEHGPDCNHDHHHDHHTAASAASTAAPEAPKGEVVCEDGVCHIRPPAGAGAVGAAAATAAAGSGFSGHVHEDYWSTQVNELVQRGHSKEAAEGALREAKYDIDAAAALLGDAGSSNKQESAFPTTPAAPARASAPAATALPPTPAPAPTPPSPAAPAVPAPAPTEEKEEEAIQQQPEATTLPAPATAAAPEQKGEEEEQVTVPPQYAEGVAALVAKGLTKRDALELMMMAKGDVGTANEILEQDQMARDLDAAVDEMVKEGWDEDVARSALLAQREKATGQKAPASLLAKKRKEEEGGAKQQQQQQGKAKEQEPAEPPIKPARKEEVVFEVTEADLQKVVIESPVPVLLDVYADWCGPCKQLGPMLEEMAVRSGGMFRLAKVNSDKNRGVSDVLQVQALPSVFALRDGMVVDNFVGIPQQGPLQEFMMRLLMGTPRPPLDPTKDPHGRTDDDLKRVGSKLAHLAGLAAFGARRKEKLEREIDALIEETTALGAEGTEGRDAEGAVKAVRTVGAYLTNLIKNFGDPKFRKVPLLKEAFQQRVAPYPPALAMLNRVGFRDDEEGHLVLRHKNRAVVIAADQIISRYLANLKKGAAAAAPIFRRQTMRRPNPPPTAAATAATATKPAAAAVKPKPTTAAALKASKTPLSLAVRLPDGGVMKTGLGAQHTLAAVFARLRVEKAGQFAHLDQGCLRLVHRGPGVVKTFVEGGAEAGKKLAELKLADAGEIVLSLVVQAPHAASDQEETKKPRKKAVSAEALAAKARAAKEKPRRTGTHTLFSEGHLDEGEGERGKGNRYYGGGSTFFEAAVDEEEEGEEEGESGSVVVEGEEEEEEEEEEDEDEEEEEEEEDEESDDEEEEESDDEEDEEEEEEEEEDEDSEDDDEEESEDDEESEDEDEE